MVSVLVNFIIVLLIADNFSSGISFSPCSVSLRLFSTRSPYSRSVFWKKFRLAGFEPSIIASSAQHSHHYTTPFLPKHACYLEPTCLWGRILASAVHIRRPNVALCVFRNITSVLRYAANCLIQITYITSPSPRPACHSVPVIGLPVSHLFLRSSNPGSGSTPQLFDALKTETVPINQEDE